MRCITVTVGRPTHPQISIDASVVCTQTTMTLFVLKSSVRGLNEHYVRLNDPTCLVTSNSSHLIASVSLNSCGTQLQENSTDLIFRNEITSFDHPHEVITRKNQVEIPFSCSFPKTGHVSSSFIAHKANYMFSEAGFGTFTYIFEFYESSEFTRIINPSQYPIEVELEQMLYMEIDVQSSIANTKLFVESCRATPHDDPYDPVYYDIISNGCVQDDTTIVYSNNQTEFRFGVAAFNFIGDYSQVYISCTVILCTSGNPGTRCAQGCMNNGSSTVYFRRRRALSLESQEHFISQGPLYLTKRAQYNNDSREMLSQNILVIVAALVVAVILISGVVIYRGKFLHYSHTSSVLCHPTPAPEWSDVAPFILLLEVLQVLSDQLPAALLGVAEALHAKAAELPRCPQSVATGLNRVDLLSSKAIAPMQPRGAAFSCPGEGTADVMSSPQKGVPTRHPMLRLLLPARWMPLMKEADKELSGMQLSAVTAGAGEPPRDHPACTGDIMMAPILKIKPP
ncbi:ZP domain-containing protein-like [Polypterus senegalus]|uniref:ZP domain-containing protein-like n=1 Tax=Polypterus senegalus TaxID=55291 RepID=UPI0019650E19|nr:ZP domain-containing protein-like [Polypterus senegalus]